MLILRNYNVFLVSTAQNLLNYTFDRLCAKLEFLLSSSTKEKSMLGNKKSYWHWTYACLKNTKGLADGLKFVQANKEVRKFTQ